MRIDEALEILHFEPKGKLRKIKADVFNCRSRAEKTFRESAAAGNSFTILEADYNVLLAWEALIRFWCQKCGAVVLESHLHCPECGKVTKRTERLIAEEVLLVTWKCRCGWEDMDYLD